jgi:hypothetical protein
MINKMTLYFFVFIYAFYRVSLFLLLLYKLYLKVYV